MEPETKHNWSPISVVLQETMNQNIYHLPQNKILFKVLRKQRGSLGKFTVLPHIPAIYRGTDPI